MKKESGVSNVVGVIILLFLVISIAAVLGLVLSSATYDAVDTTPNVIFTTSEDPYLLYHGGGDVLYKNDLKFYAGGSDISDSISIDGVYDWTGGWHTGQAINTENTGRTVSDLTIVTLDSRGDAYLIYNGPTADPIPEGTPVPDETPEPTTTPTAAPTPVQGDLDASFTLTSVNPGLNVSMSGLPISLTTTTDWIVVMSGGSDSHATVTFTANADNLSYAWSVPPGVSIDNAALRSPTMIFDESGDYTVTLTVTNSSGSLLSSTKNISVRNPGLTAMTWVNRKDNLGNKVESIFADDAATNPKWQLSYYNQNGANKNYINMMVDFSDAGSKYVHSSIVLGKGTWYHVTGTYNQTGSSGVLTIYVNGVSSEPKNLDNTGILDMAAANPRWVNDDMWNTDDSYEIPFALTANEIAAVYDAEKFVIHT